MMTCEGQRDKLKFAAATNGALSSGVHAHFTNCLACRGWLLMERQRSDRMDAFVRGLEAHPRAQGMFARLMKRFGW